MPLFDYDQMNRKEKKTVYVPPETKFLPCECYRERNTRIKQSEHQLVNSGFLYDIYECIHCGRTQRVGR